MGKGVYPPSTPAEPQRMKALLAKGLIEKELRPRAPMFFDRQYEKNAGNGAVGNSGGSPL
jgi:hypothetical protein